MIEILYNIDGEAAEVFEGGKIKFEDGTEKQCETEEQAYRFLYKIGYRF